MTDLEKYQLINSCETVEDLEKAILAFQESDGSISGRTRDFNAERMASYVKGVVTEGLVPNFLTRKFGIRQQALYLRYYNNM